MIFKLLLATILMACWFASDVTCVVTCDSGQATGFTCPASNGYNYFPGDCSKFIQCSNGIPSCLDCPVPLEWNLNTEQCDWPQNAGCTAESTGATPADTTAVPVDTSAAPADTTKPATTTEYPYEEAEEEYYTTKKY